MKLFDLIRGHRAGVGIASLVFFVWLPKGGDESMTEKGKAEEESELAKTGRIEAEE